MKVRLRVCGEPATSVAQSNCSLPRVDTVKSIQALLLQELIALSLNPATLEVRW